MTITTTPSGSTTTVPSALAQGSPLDLDALLATCRAWSRPTYFGVANRAAADVGPTLATDWLAREVLGAPIVPPAAILAQPVLPDDEPQAPDFAKEDTQQWNETLARHQQAWADLQAGTSGHGDFQEAADREQWYRRVTIDRYFPEEDEDG